MRRAENSSNQSRNYYRAFFTYTERDKSTSLDTSEVLPVLRGGGGGGGGMGGGGGGIGRVVDWSTDTVPLPAVRRGPQDSLWCMVALSLVR